MWVAHQRCYHAKSHDRNMFQESVTAAAARNLTLGEVGIATRVNGDRSPDVPLSDIDLGAWQFWVLDDDLRDGAFATLRREAPISFHEPLERPGSSGGAGHWALTRFDDVYFASRHPRHLQLQPEHHHRRRRPRTRRSTSGR